MSILFWLSIFALFYAYVGYPISLVLLSFYKKRPVLRQEDYCPRLSLIITVHNEEERLPKKIENTLNLDYPKEKLEIIFASDASTDQTDEIIASYERFKLVRSPERRGKEYAQKGAVEQSRGDILVFSDVATMLDREGLRNIAANFADPTVGCVSSEDRFIDEKGHSSGEGAYVKYEMFLRHMESKVFSLVGLSGSFFAARRDVCQNWAVDLQSDFNTLLNSLKGGLRGVSDPKTLGYYRNIADEKKEFSRKVRTVLRGLTVVSHNLTVLNFRKYGLFSWELFSHKICRWLVPFFLFLALLSNFFLLSHGPIYILFFILQVTFYLLGLFHSKMEAKLLSRGKKAWQNKIVAKLISFSKISNYFIMVNAAIVVAWFKLFKGERTVFWNPSKR